MPSLKPHQKVPYFNGKKMYLYSISQRWIVFGKQLSNSVHLCLQKRKKDNYSSDWIVT